MEQRNTSTIKDNPNYRGLKTELRVCKIGGIFLALYQDERVIDLIIHHLKQDLSEQFVFSLEMTPQKVGFPTFFEQSFEQTGTESNVFHVRGIEQLSEQLQSNFINYLQYTRERFKAKPYSIVFWVTPEFRKRLFFSAPDFYEWIFGVYDFSKIEVNEETQENTNPSKFKEVSLDNITQYLEKAIWQYEHWDEVKERGEEFLIEVMERANLHEYYVQTYCLDKNNETRLLDDILEDFLANEERHFLTLLGDFGTGKSSFSLHYFIQLAKRYVQDQAGRIPIFISLKDYPGKINIEDFIAREFYETFKIELSFHIFQRLALQGKFIFFVDGFDEMASLSDRQVTEENFKELTKLTFENILFMTNSSRRNLNANKVFLTCRTHYFFDEDQERKIIKSSRTVLYRDYATKTNYELTRINLKEFSVKQIEEYVFKHTRNKETTQNILGIINDTYNLKELSIRPILLDMIVKTLPSLKNKTEVNAAELYKAYTEMWILRDDNRSQMTAEGKRAFMWELAFKMFMKGGKIFLHYTEIDKPEEKYLKQGFQNQKDDYYYMYETTTCSFLNRDEKGNYKFIHKSFMEYFLAEYYFSRIKNQEKRICEPFSLNLETTFFLKFIISSEKTDLKNLDLSSLNLQSINLENANLSKAVLSGSSFRYAIFIKSNLSETDLRVADLSDTNLKNIKLEGSNLSGANLFRADLTNANLTNSDLRGINLKETKLRGADLEGAKLYREDVTGVDLSHAYCQKLIFIDKETENTSS